MPDAEPARPTVLLSGAGGAGTIEIIRSLRRAGRYRVVAIDATPTAYGLFLADAGYRVPFAREPHFEEALGEILRRERPRFLIPLVDEEIPIFHRAAERCGAVVLTPSPAFAELAMDKWRMTDALRQVGVSVPETWLASSAEAAIYPAVVKPRRGRGSRGLAYVGGPDEVSEYLRRAASGPDDYLVQSRVYGAEFTCSVVAAVGGPLLAVVPKEVIVKQGITQAAVTRRAPAVERTCAAIWERLRAGGPFNVQLIVGADGEPRVIEVNPRYSTTVALTQAAGVEEVELVIRHAMGEGAPRADFTPDLVMVRYATQEYMPEAEWLGLRGALVDLSREPNHA